MNKTLTLSLIIAASLGVAACKPAETNTPEPMTNEADMNATVDNAVSDMNAATNEAVNVADNAMEGNTMAADNATAAMDNATANVAK